MKKTEIQYIKDENLKNYLMSVIDDFEDDDEKEIDDTIEFFNKQRGAFSDVNKRKAAHVELNDISIFAKDGDFIEVTEWTNGDGFDLYISRNGGKETFLPMEYDVFEALVNLVNKIGFKPVIYTEQTED